MYKLQNFDLNFDNELVDEESRLRQIGQRRILKLRSAIFRGTLYSRPTARSFYQYSRDGLGG